MKNTILCLEIYKYNTLLHICTDGLKFFSSKYNNRYALTNENSNLFST